MYAQLYVYLQLVELCNIYNKIKVVDKYDDKIKFNPNKGIYACILHLYLIKHDL